MDIKGFEKSIIAEYKGQEWRNRSVTYGDARLSAGYLKHTGLADVEYSVTIDFDSGEIKLLTFDENSKGAACFVKHMFYDAIERYRGHVILSYADGVE